MIKEDIMEIKKEVNELKEQSLAYEILQDSKKANKRMFILLVIVLCMWFTTIGYLVYILNDIGTVSETITQENSSGYNNYIGNDGDIINGKANDN